VSQVDGAVNLSYRYKPLLGSVGNDFVEFTYARGSNGELYNSITLIRINFIIIP
jgi:hypothetical protein